MIKRIGRQEVEGELDNIYGERIRIQKVEDGLYLIYGDWETGSRV